MKFSAYELRAVSYYATTHGLTPSLSVRTERIVYFVSRNGQPVAVDLGTVTSEYDGRHRVGRLA